MNLEPLILIYIIITPIWFVVCAINFWNRDVAFLSKKTAARALLSTPLWFLFPAWAVISRIPSAISFIPRGVVDVVRSAEILPTGKVESGSGQLSIPATTGGELSSVRIQRGGSDVAGD